MSPSTTTASCTSAQATTPSFRQSRRLGSAAGKSRARTSDAIKSAGQRSQLLASRRTVRALCNHAHFWLFSIRHSPFFHRTQPLTPHLRRLAGYDSVVAACASACKALSPPADVFALECAGSSGTACKCRQTGASSPSDAKTQVDLETSGNQALGGDTAWYGCFSKASTSSYSGALEYDDGDPLPSGSCADFLACTVACAQQGMLFWQDRHAFSNGNQGCVLASSITAANGWTKWSDADCQVADSWNMGVGWWKGNLSDGVEKMAIYSDGCRGHRGLSPCNGTAPITHHGVEWALGGSSRASVYFIPPPDTVAMMRVAPPSNFSMSLLNVVQADEPRGMALSGSYLYTTAGDGMAVFDVTSPTAPTLVGTVIPSSDSVMQRISVSPAYIGIAVLGSYAYVTERDSGALAVLSIARAQRPRGMGVVKHAMLAGAVAVAVVADRSGQPAYAYVAGSYADALVVVDIDDAVSPRVVGSVISSTYLNQIYDVAVGPTNQKLYVVGRISHSLAVVDVSLPSAPTIVGGLINANQLRFATACALWGGSHVVVVGSQTVATVDVSDPTLPRVVGSVSDRSKIDYMSGVAVDGDHAYVAGTDSNSVGVVDLTNPAAPVVVSSLSSTGLFTFEEPDSVAVLHTSRGSYAYASAYGSDGLVVLGIPPPPPSNVCDQYCPAKCNRAVAAAAAALNVDLTRGAQIAANMTSFDGSSDGSGKPTFMDFLGGGPGVAVSGTPYSDGSSDGSSGSSGRRLYAQTSGVPRTEAECAECAGCRAAGYHVTSMMQWKEPFHLDNNEYLLGACDFTGNSTTSNSTSSFLSTDSASPTLLGAGTDARLVTLNGVVLDGSWLSRRAATTVAQDIVYTPTADTAWWYACDVTQGKAAGIKVSCNVTTGQISAYVHDASYTVGGGSGACDAYPLTTSAPSAPSSSGSGYGVAEMNYTITTPTCQRFPVHPAFYEFGSSQLDSFMSLTLPYLVTQASPSPVSTPSSPPSAPAQAPVPSSPSLTLSSVLCGCEVSTWFFCNHDNGAGSGSCEPCSDHSSADSCVNDGLLSLGVADCLYWCFGVTDFSQFNTGSYSGSSAALSSASMQSMLDFFERPCETFCQTECAKESEALSGGHCAICAYMCPNVYAGGKTWIVRTANPSDTDIYLSTDTGGRWLPMPGVATTIELPEARVVVAFSSMCDLLCQLHEPSAS